MAHEVIPDCNNAKLSGLYIMSSATVNYPPLIRNGQYSLLRVSARTSDEILQEVFCCGISGQYDFSAVRSYGNTDSWSPWEYINPPMFLGVEYRTTERYLGKPVYCKLVNAGLMPSANNAKLVAHGIADVRDCLRCNATWSDVASFPYRIFGTVTLDRTNITLDSGAQVDYPNTDVLVTMYYTKTTD